MFMMMMMMMMKFSHSLFEFYVRYTTIMTQLRISYKYTSTFDSISLQFLSSNN